MTDINAVIAFYRARLDEEEQSASATAEKHGRTWSSNGEYLHVQDTGGGRPIAVNPWGGHSGPLGPHIARHDPARVLKMVAAGRKLVHLYWRTCDQIEMLAGHGIDATGSKVAEESYANAILVNAAVWDDHQDWDASWRPGWLDEIGYLPHPERSEA